MAADVRPAARAPAPSFAAPPTRPAALPTRPAAASPGLSAAPLPARTPLSPEQVERSRRSAEEFEAMAVAQMLQPMFNTVDTSKGLFGGGKGEAAWKPMMVEEMGKMLAKSGGIGIADAVLKEMLRMQETGRE